MLSEITKAALRKLRRWASHDPDSPAEIVMQRGALRFIAESVQARKFRFCVEDAYPDGDVNAELTMELYFTTVGRCICSIGNFWQTGWLPACHYVPSLADNLDFCPNCALGKCLHGTDFFDYLTENRSTLQPKPALSLETPFERER